MRSGVMVGRAEHHNLEPRARSEGMATRRGVWQVAAYSLPPDRYILGMGVPRTLTIVRGRWGEFLATDWRGFRGLRLRVWQVAAIWGGR